VQARALGEVGILGTVLLRAYSGTFFPIFIEIGSHLTDKTQKISWHSFVETRCISYIQDYYRAMPYSAKRGLPIAIIACRTRSVCLSVSMTLDDLERLKRHSCGNKLKVLRSPPEKNNFNEDKCIY